MKDMAAKGRGVGGNSKKTHCPKGHPLIYNGYSQRICHICQAEAVRRYRAKQKREE